MTTFSFIRSWRRRPWLGQLRRERRGFPDRHGLLLRAAAQRDGSGEPPPRSAHVQGHVQGEDAQGAGRGAVKGSCEGRIQGTILRLPDLYGPGVSASFLGPNDVPHDVFVPDVGPVVLAWAENRRRMGGGGISQGGCDYSARDCDEGICDGRAQAESARCREDHAAVRRFIQSFYAKWWRCIICLPIRC